MIRDDTGSEFSLLVEYIRSERGIDFASYKPSSLERRLHKRMQMLQTPSYAAYLDHLQATPEEFTPLLDTLFINVTRFFHDPDAWAILRDKVLPRILESKGRTAPIRVWCAGMASGEEAYSVAMLFAEALGANAFYQRVKVYATDIDEGALALARRGQYSDTQLEDVDEDLRHKYFDRNGDQFAFRPDLRRCVIFGRHNLLEDAPISRLDLLICRNTIMYFNREAQGRILARFHFALRDDGFLFLGKAEMLLTRRSLFVPADALARIFSKSSDLSLRDRLSSLSRGAIDEEQHSNRSPHLHLRDLAFDKSPVPQLLVDRTGSLALANEAARTLFGLSGRDMGRPFQDFELSYRPVELRAPLDEVLAERRSRVLAGVQRPGPDGRDVYYDVHLTPVPDNAGNPAAVGIAFVDVTADHVLQAQLEQTRNEVETAYEELQSVNEELETTNEELQSTIEELETTNEELQSTNEELETMNEELQSSNEEIRSVNEELRQRSEIVSTLNAYMNSILNSVQVGVVVLNTDLEVHLWNEKASDLWGLRGAEVESQPFLNLDIGLRVDQLRELMFRALRGEGGLEAVLLDAHNRRGKRLDCRVTCAPLHGPGNVISGIILTMEEWSGAEVAGGDRSAEV